MTSIQNQPMAQGMPNTYSPLSDAQVASYMRKQSVNAYESLNAGLTIQTKEGDTVTLSSSSYAQLDSFLYDSSGVVQTAEGAAAVSVSQREVTLTSGESFSFSVVGNLSEEELADIEAIVKGIDEIISEMAEGDMDEAVEKALEMGTYDTVSMYAADITYQRNVEAVVETQAQAAQIGSAAAAESEILPKDRPEMASTIEPFPENRAPKKKRKNSIADINQFIEKIAEQLEKHEDKLVKAAQKPVDKLFDKHLEDLDDDVDDRRSAFNAVEKAKEKFNTYIDKMFEKIFDAQMSLF